MQLIETCIPVHSLNKDQTTREILCEHKNRAIGPNEVRNMDSFDTKREEMFSIHIVRETLKQAEEK